MLYKIPWSCKTVIVRTPGGVSVWQGIRNCNQEVSVVTVLDLPMGCYIMVSWGLHMQDEPVYDKRQLCLSYLLSPTKFMVLLYSFQEVLPVLKAEATTPDQLGELPSITGLNPVLWAFLQFQTWALANTKRCRYLHKYRTEAASFPCLFGDGFLKHRCLPRCIGLLSLSVSKGNSELVRSELEEEWPRCTWCIWFQGISQACQGHGCQRDHRIDQHIIGLYTWYFAFLKWDDD